MLVIVLKPKLFIGKLLPVRVNLNFFMRNLIAVVVCAGAVNKVILKPMLI